MSGQGRLSEEVLHYQMLEWEVVAAHEFTGERVLGLGNQIYKSLAAGEKLWFIH